MPKLTYPGPFEAVDVPSLGLHDVKRGATVEVPDDAAEALVAQGWKRAAEKKADTAATPTKAATAAKKEK